MARRSIRRFGVVSMAALMLAASFSFATAPPANAALYNPIPANADGDLEDYFYDNESIWAYMTSDLAGGQYCIVAVTGSGSCDGGAVMGTGSFVGASIGTLFRLVKNAPLTPGTFRLRLENSVGDLTAYSAPFTVVPCVVGCDLFPDAAIVQDYKDAAAGYQTAMDGMCAMNGVLEKVAGKATGMRGIKKTVSAKVTGSLSLSTTRFAMTVSVTGTLFSFTMVDPLTANINKALDILKEVSCGAAKMYEDMVNDPPDPNFEVVAPVEPYDIDPLTPESLDTVVASIDRERALQEAVLRAFERYQGAEIAGDIDAQIIQLRAAGTHAQSLANEMFLSADALRDWADDAATDPDIAGVVLPSADAPDYIALYQRVRDTGFTADEVGQFKSVGYSDADIAEIRTHASVPIEDLATDTTYSDALRTVADDLESNVDAVADFASEMFAVAGRLEAADNPPNQAPVASFTATPTSGNAPLNVTFTSTSTDPDGDVLSATWDFGDGQTGTGTSVSHAYAAGSYTATLVVSDGTLTDFATTSITATSVGANDDPILTDDVATTAVNTPVGISVLNNDYDPNGQTLAITSITAPSHGSATCTATTCVYTPGPDYVGPDSFDYTASDGVGGSATATVSITVTPGADDNAPPIAGADSATTPVNKIVWVYVIGNDSDPDFNPLSVAVATQPANGVVECYWYGWCTYMPAADFVGTDSFTYTLGDGRGGTDVATVTITVEPNRDPVALDDVLTTRENGSVRTVSVLSNDIDPDGDALSLTSNTAAAHGTVTCTSFGACTYAPDPGYTGPDAFDYTISDGVGGAATATVHVTVTENHAPVAGDDTAETVETRPVHIFVLGNDTDEDFETVTIAGNTQPAHGTVECSLYCLYTPEPGFVGTDGFDYTASDGDLTDIGHVTITVHPACYPARCIENGTVLLAVNPAGQLNASDGTGSAAGLGSVGLHFIPTNNDATAPGCLCEGWGAGDAGSGISGSANVAVDGVQNMTVESFVVTDSTAVSTVTIGDTLRVTHGYHPSTETPNLYEVTVTIENISGGPLSDIRYRRVMDWDIEPTPFWEYVTVQGGNATALLYSSNNGFATADPLGARTDMGFTGDFVDAGPNDHGALFDFGFGALATGESTTFNIFYGAGDTQAEAEAAINAVGAEVYSIGKPTTPDGLTLGAPNTFIFAFGSVGGDPIFSPVAVDDTLTTAVDTPGVVDVLANDSDPDGDPITVTTLTPTAAHGTVSCTAAGLCTYTPDAGYSGPDSFDYEISDGQGGSDTGTVSVTVTPGETQPPVGVADSYTTPRDTVLTIAAPGVLTNDTDADGDTLTATKVGDPAHGSVVLDADGSFEYTPDAGYVGPDSFTYDVNDGTTTVGPVTVSIDVTAVNQAPVGVADSYSGPEDADLVVSAALGVLANDTDADGNTLTATKVGNPVHGSVTLNADGSFTYSPDAGYVGTDSFTYTASDGLASSAVTTVSLTIEAINHAPTLVVVADQTIPEMVLFEMDLLGADGDGDTLAYTAPTKPEGLAVGAATGALSWTPTEAQGPGEYDVTVRVTDPDGLYAERSFTITVTEVNRDPSLAAIADQTVNPGDVVNLTAAGSDPDVPANTLTYSLISGPAGATVNPTTGAFAWTASTTLDAYPVTIGVSDGKGGSAQRSFTIDVVRDATALTLGGDTGGQYSDRATITATLEVGSTPIAGASVAISLGTASQTVTTDASGVASATFAIPGPAGSLATGASYAGTPALAPSTVAGTFSVAREDSTIAYSGDTIGLASSALTLSATFTDSAASGYAGSNPEAGSGATIGDITKARISFAVYTAANCLSGSPITTLSAFVTDTGPAGDGIGQASVTWSSASEGTFCIVTSLVGAAGTGSNGYYAAQPADPGALAVFIDTTGKVTGGGFVVNADGRHNFGFNATSAKGKVKGNLVFIERTIYDGQRAIIIVKSNAISALRTSGTTYPITATLTGKATIKVISAATGAVLHESGNATITATVIDTNAKGSPSGDSFGIRVLSRTGLVLVDLNTTLLDGGQVRAHLK